MLDSNTTLHVASKVSTQTRPANRGFWLINSRHTSNTGCLMWWLSSAVEWPQRTGQMAANGVGVCEPRTSDWKDEWMVGLQEQMSTQTCSFLINVQTFPHSHYCPPLFHILYTDPVFSLHFNVNILFISSSSVICRYKLHTSTHLHS